MAYNDPGSSERIDKTWGGRRYKTDKAGEPCRTNTRKRKIVLEGTAGGGRGGGMAEVEW